MKKSILVLSLVLTCVVAARAQSNETAASAQGSSQNSAVVALGAQTVNLGSNTSLTAQLQNTIDVRKARVGDEVVLKTTQVIKSEGRTVVGKGARLIGHVSEVAQRGKDGASSRVGLIFDRLEHGSLAMPISATITSVTNIGASPSAGGDDMFTNSNTSNRSSSSASANGGLLGGVGSAANSTTSTVGSVLGSTTSAVGSTVNSTTNAVGGTATGVGRSVSRIRVAESSSASAEGGSVLTLQGDNLRLEKGASFNLVVTQSAAASTNRNQ